MIRRTASRRGTARFIRPPGYWNVRAERTSAIQTRTWEESCCLFLIWETGCLLHHFRRIDPHHLQRRDQLPARHRRRRQQQGFALGILFRQDVVPVVEVVE